MVMLTTIVGDLVVCLVLLLISYLLRQIREERHRTDLIQRRYERLLLDLLNDDGDDGDDDPELRPLIPIDPVKKEIPHE